MQNEEVSNMDDSKSKMLSGSAWMTAGSIFSRILGAVYIIPWGIIFGNYFFKANGLYTKGYTVYSFLLIIAIAGIPSAIAKQVAHYNSMNEYGVGVRLYKRGLLLSISLGIIFAGIFYLSAPILSGGDQNVTLVMKSLAWAVLLIPTLSLTRGYFQGYQEMAPSAVSQFVEQLARVIYMLVSAYFIIVVLKGNWVTAVVHSTFAAFVGAFFGLLVLFLYYLKRKSYFKSVVANSNNKIKVDSKKLYKEIIAQAVPFIILGSGITIFQLIDQYTFFSIMNFKGGYTASALNDIFTVFAGNSNKLVMIVISLSSALAVTAVPLLSQAFTRGNKKSISDQITNSLILFAFVMFPGALGMAAVAGPINRAFYGQKDMIFAENVLVIYALVAIILGLFTVVSAVMQGISQNKRAVKYFFIGVLVKFILQIPLVYMLGAFGTLISTAIGLMLTCYLIIRKMNIDYNLDKLKLEKGFNMIGLFSIIMFFVTLISVFILNYLFSLFIDPTDRKISFVITVIAAIIGMMTYLHLTLKSRLADKIIGSKADNFRKLLRIK
ncbi:oligosaccharide flippase family protein [Lactobacillus sp. S2-2]|uniref:putative polysaccharide biosynthesis protein n=1 Tax=Lactobacillus sp. S2-2 TaxID=2692917 RepID=UPI001F35B87E|nr:polysaccharide biosynthesis protein [Lactobacillus sp. S2-2]MCF6515183.1 oligosaccharide flippase family protein [Lactobacillus sp. S2-2]